MKYTSKNISGVLPVGMKLLVLAFAKGRHLRHLRLPNQMPWKKRYNNKELNLFLLLLVYQCFNFIWKWVWQSILTLAKARKAGLQHSSGPNTIPSMSTNLMSISGTLCSLSTTRCPRMYKSESRTASIWGAAVQPVLFTWHIDAKQFAQGYRHWTAKQIFAINWREQGTRQAIRQNIIIVKYQYR